MILMECCSENTDWNFEKDSSERITRRTRCILLFQYSKQLQAVANCGKREAPMNAIEMEFYSISFKQLFSFPISITI